MGVVRCRKFSGSSSLEPPADTHGFAEEFAALRRKSGAANALISVSLIKKLQDNLRDGLPYPYTEQDGRDYILAMLSANKDETFAFAVTADKKVIGSIGIF